MLRRLPILSSMLSFGDFFYGFARIADQNAPDDFSAALANALLPSRAYLTNSGASSFYIILESLKKISQKKEVILPAYTAGSLVVAILKAGLEPVLTDISLGDFNIDRDSLLKAVSSDTLAVVCVHMFGIAMDDIREIKSRVPAGVFLIEDCAQAMGSRALDRYTGNFGDASFFSFNRSKNLAVYGGGCIATSNTALAAQIEKKLINVKTNNLFSELMKALKIASLLLVNNRFLYSLLYPLLSLFKETAPPKGFAIGKLSNMQAAVARELLEKLEGFSKKRYDTGMKILQGLKGVEGVILPEILNDTRPAFNRLPVVFKDFNKKEAVELELNKAGIEVSRMYLRPLHHMFDLGYSKDDFPNATYFAKHLLTLPVHPKVTGKDLETMIDLIREALI